MFGRPLIGLPRRRSLRRRPSFSRLNDNSICQRARYHSRTGPILPKQRSQNLPILFGGILHASIIHEEVVLFQYLG